MLDKLLEQRRGICAEVRRDRRPSTLARTDDEHGYDVAVARRIKARHAKPPKRSSGALTSAAAVRKCVPRLRGAVTAPGIAPSAFLELRSIEDVRRYVRRHVLERMRAEQAPHGVARAQHLGGFVARELREVRKRYAGIEISGLCARPVHCHREQRLDLRRARTHRPMKFTYGVPVIARVRKHPRVGNRIPHTAVCLHRLAAEPRTVVADCVELRHWFEPISARGGRC